MDHHRIKIIVIGGLITDIIASGVKELLGSGELTRSGSLVIGPGGKSRNMAQMMAVFLGSGRVAMVGRTSKDPFGLWRVPVDALEASGVHTGFIKIFDFEASGQYPGIALIPVNRQGENQIYCLPGINDAFCPGDIDDADILFDQVKDNRGILALSLELPTETAIYAARKAASNHIRVVLDPGGLDKDEDYGALLDSHIFIIKPNEHEAEALTGIPIVDFGSARRAAGAFFRMGISNVVITHGKDGAYLFTGKEERHIKVPQSEPADTAGGTADETGCGDQAMAVLCSEISRGEDLAKAAAAAVMAGTIQYSRIGIQPVTRKELSGA